MHTQLNAETRYLPNYYMRLACGLLVLTLTLLLIITAVGPFFNSLVIDETCETAAEKSYESFAAETAVPDCWLVQ